MVCVLAVSDFSICAFFNALPLIVFIVVSGVFAHSGNSTSSATKPFLIKQYFRVGLCSYGTVIQLHLKNNVMFVPPAL